MRRVTAVIFLSFFFGLVSSQAETFQNPRRNPADHDPDILLHGDVNGDGHDDLIYGDSSTNPQTLHVLLGTGNGNFTPGYLLTLPPNVGVTCVLNDFNGDHRLDIACARSVTDYTGATQAVYIFPGNGDGTFGAPTTIALPDDQHDPLALMDPGDLNGDGAPDILVMEVQVYEGWPILSDGHGGLKAGPRGPYYGIPTAFADVNGDGKADALFKGPTVALGNGDGTFAKPTSYNPYDYVSRSLDGCAFGDIDNDHHIDAVCAYLDTVNGDVIGQATIEIFHGKTDGSFALPPTSILSFGGGAGEDYGSLASPRAIADFDGDGIPDILGFGEGGVTIYYGKGGGQYADAVHFAAGDLSSDDGIYFSQNWVLSDVNGDGLPDLVCDDLQGVYVSLANRDRTLETASAYQVNSDIGYAAVADFNGDGIPDVVSSGAPNMAISLGRGDGSFGPYTKIDTGNTQPDDGTSLIVHGDFNGDGKQDIIAVGSEEIGGSTTTGIYYLQGNGDGTFQPPAVTSGINTFGGANAASRVADFNGDHLDDLISAPDGDTGTLHVALSNGDGTFVDKISFVPQESDAAGTVFLPETLPGVADFDEDGKPDIVTASGDLAFVLFGKGDGTFVNNLTTAVIPPLPNGKSGEQARSVITGDFDGDGHKDFAVLWGGVLLGKSLQDPNDEIVIFYGNGHGTFSPAVVATTTSNGYAFLEAADLNRDGRDEIVAFASGIFNGGTAMAVLHGSANRTWDPPTPYLAGDGLANLQIADLNRDGFPDLIFSNGDSSGGDSGTTPNSVTVLLNLGNKPAVTGVLNATPEPSNVGLTFVLTASLATPDNSILSGTVNFSIDGLPAGSAALNNNIATLSVPDSISGSLTIGKHSLAATWPGNTVFDPIVLSGTHTVLGLPTALMLISSSPVSTVGDSVAFTSTLTTTASPASPAGGTLTLSENGVELHSVTLSAAALPYTDTFSIATLARGMHTLTATYSGDNVYIASSATVSQTVNGIDTSMTLQASPSPAYAGQSVTLQAQLQQSTTCSVCSFSGTVQFFDGGVSLGSGTVSSSGLATLPVNFTTAGAHSLTANFAGDSFHQPATASASEQVLRVTTELALTSSLNPSTRGVAVQFTAKVASTSLSGIIPTGNVTFSDGSVSLGTFALNASGSASVTTSNLVVGTHTISATFAQAAAAETSSSSLQQQVNPASTTTLLSAAPNPAYQSQSLTLTASIQTSTGFPASGPVSFFDSGSPIGSATIANGAGVLSISTLAVGSHTITATYAGNTDIGLSISNTVVVQVLASDFNLTATPPDLTVPTEHHLTFTVAANSIGNFADQINFSVDGLAPHMTVLFTPTTKFLSSGGTAAVSVDLDTDDLLNFKSSNQSPDDKTALFCFLLGAPFLAFTFRLRRKARVGLWSVLAASLLFAVSGCGSKYPASTPPGNYTIHIHAVGATTHVSHELDIPVNVIPE